MRETTSISRREFIKVSTSALFGLGGLLGLGGLIRYFSFHAPEARNEFDLGLVEDYPVGSRTLRSDIPALICNRDGELVAFSLLCTHLGCTLKEDHTEFECPCHRSRFDANGNVLAGPAQRPLKKLRLEILKDHELILHT